MFPIPTNCPECDTELKISNTVIDLYCPNSDGCSAQILGRLSYFCQRNIANIAGLSEKTIAKFIQDYNLHDIPDLYTLPWSQIVLQDGFGAKSVQNLQESIESSKKIADYKFLAGLGIEGVGPEVAKLICEHLSEV
jgi:DNA ligase (NAD+)